jgi:hypothetical protein
MDLLGDVGHMESHFLLFGDRAGVGVRQVHGFSRNIPSAQESFWTHPMALLGDEAQVKACFALFGDGANLDTR